MSHYLLKSIDVFLVDKTFLKLNKLRKGKHSVALTKRHPYIGSPGPLIVILVEGVYLVDYVLEVELLLCNP